jgi:hypothetical protein
MTQSAPPSDTRARLRVLLAELIAGEGSEQQMDELYEAISRISPHPGWSDFVFHSAEFVRDDGTDLDGLVDRICAHQPIRLPDLSAEAASGDDADAGSTRT